MPDQFSDDSMLSAEDKALLRKMREDNEITHRAPPDQRSKLDPRKQDFPIGVRPDGTLNLIEDNDEDDS